MTKDAILTFDLDSKRAAADDWTRALALLSNLGLRTCTERVRLPTTTVLGTVTLNTTDTSAADVRAQVVRLMREHSIPIKRLAVAFCSDWAIMQE